MAAFCIVAHNAFGALTGVAGHIGGIERQTAMLAKFLANSGHRVSFITWDEGHEDIQQVSGVEILRICAKKAGLPGLRFFVPRWSSLRKRLKQAEADLYYQNGAEYVTGQVAHFCRQSNRRFVFTAASDVDCQPQLPSLTTIRERVLYRYGLRNADCRIVQTVSQQSSMYKGFGLDSVVLPMPCAINVGQIVRESTGNPVALWVGRIVPTKRLEWFLDIAEAIPNVIFRIIGGSDDDPNYADNLIARAKTIQNVEYLGSIPFDDVRQQYSNAQLLVCTSSLEGFPNTFLEAWANGIPVITSFDPDNLVAKRELGTSANDVAGLVAAISQFTQDAQLLEKTSIRCIRYFEQTHSRETALARFEALFNKTLQARRANV